MVFWDGRGPEPVFSEVLTGPWREAAALIVERVYPQCRRITMFRVSPYPPPALILALSCAADAPGIRHHQTLTSHRRAGLPAIRQRAGPSVPSGGLRNVGHGSQQIVDFHDQHWGRYSGGGIRTHNPSINSRMLCR